MSTMQERLHVLRKLMHSHQLDYYIAPNSDPHNNEIPPECWSRRPWVTGFTGSAGEALIGQEHAYLSTDGRYFLQATNQMDKQFFSLLKQTAYLPKTADWLTANANNSSIGIDPKTISIKRANNLSDELAKSGNKLLFIDENLIDTCRLHFNQLPELPQSEAFILNQQYTGESCDSKLKWLKAFLSEHSANYLVLNTLDEICWLLNLRAADVENTPLLISYVIVSQDKTYLFTDPQKLNAEVSAYLEKNHVTISEYKQFEHHLKHLEGTIILDEQQSSMWIYNLASHNSNNTIIYLPSPIIMKKSCKNKIEQAGARQAHSKDAVAIINFLYWLEQNWRYGITEIDAATKLKEFRLQMPHAIDLSFETKSAFASNGAVIHYDPTAETNKVIDNSSLYLFDSGTQYLESTTDITRTVHLGEATAEQKKHYTLVLKGHLALGRAKFPQGTCGEHLDALARMYLWEEGLDYQHGTGHGVGSTLCVHEGPQKISKVSTGVALKPGMIISNEPGLYLEDHYGIRIENLCLVTDQSTATTPEGNAFYCFETLTLIPYCKALIDTTLLTAQEKHQLNSYYQAILSQIAPLLSPDVRKWLKQECDIQYVTQHDHATSLESVAALI